jgi:hypothetical protein
MNLCAAGGTLTHTRPRDHFWHTKLQMGKSIIAPPLQGQMELFPKRLCGLIDFQRRLKLGVRR